MRNSETNIVGVGIRTNKWRYAEWVKYDHGSPSPNKKIGKPIFDEKKIYAIELYDCFCHCLRFFFCNLPLEQGYSN